MTRPTAMEGAAPPAIAPAVTGAALAELATEFWDARLRADPIEATLLGDHRFAAELPDPTPAANAERIARLEALERRVRQIDARVLETGDRVTHAALLGAIENELATRRCALADWTLDPREGPHVTFQNLAQLTPVTDVREGHAMIERWQKMGAHLDARAENLVAAAAEGRVAARRIAVRVLRQLDELLATPVERWVLMGPAHAQRTGWFAEDQQRFAAGIRKAVTETIKPALERYRAAIRDKILPVARADDNVGLDRVPRGATCYERLIRVHTSLELGADQIHRIGLDEIARIRAEMIDLGERLFGTRDLGAIQDRLRNDKTVYFTSREEIEAKASEALRRAETLMPKWFGRIAKTPCQVMRVEPYEEQDTYIAYYREPAVDGSRPGRYYVNTYAPETRPRYEAEALAFHESVPGHHTQIALAMEAQGVPEFRRHIAVTAYAEGWALYGERLAAEMGLYSADLDRMGMLSFDAWRASRLVVDTGLHTQGWSRQRAVDYMVANTALARNNIENEVDRYIGWPAQALAYKLGQREMFALRTLAEQRLGARFDVRAFHDQVLGHGAVSLAVLRSEIERWLDLEAAAAAAR